jgi:hypothetical protein
VSREILWGYTRTQAQELAGREITDDEADLISEAIGHSTAREAAEDAVFAVCGSPDEKDES